MNANNSRQQSHQMNMRSCIRDVLTMGSDSNVRSDWELTTNKPLHNSLSSRLVRWLINSKYVEKFRLLTIRISFSGYCN
jgi:hypothetical protein